VEHLKGSLLGLAPALPANIRLSWKSLPGTNTLAYYENPKITDKIFFITLAPGFTLKKLFFAFVAAAAAAAAVVTK
jgi:hypothetical protein